MFNTKRIAYYSVYTAIMLIMGMVPFLGYIPLGPVRITIMTLPVILITIHFKWHGAIFGACLMGLTSFISGFYNSPLATTMMENYGVGQWFANSFVTRLALGLAVAGITILLDKTKWDLRIKILIIAFSILSLNTVFFLGCLSLIMTDKSFLVWFTTSGVNIAVEWTLLPVVSLAFYPYMKHIALRGEI